MGQLDRYGLLLLVVLLFILVIGFGPITWCVWFYLLEGHPLKSQAYIMLGISVVMAAGGVAAFRKVLQ